MKANVTLNLLHIPTLQNLQCVSFLHTIIPHFGDAEQAKPTPTQHQGNFYWPCPKNAEISSQDISPPSHSSFCDEPICLNESHLFQTHFCKAKQLLL